MKLAILQIYQGTVAKFRSELITSIPFQIIRKPHFEINVYYIYIYIYIYIYKSLFSQKSKMLKVKNEYFLSKSFFPRK